MKIIFNKTRAEEAIFVFETLLKNRNVINGKNLGFILLPVMAYLNVFTIKELKEQVPTLLDSVLPMLKQQDFMTCMEQPTKKECTWKYGFNMQKFRTATNEFEDVPKVSEDICYLFVNCLFNMQRYIKEFKIASWNTLSLALECTLKTGYSNNYISLSNDDMKSVTGNTANKYCAKKSLVDLGFLKKREKVAGEFSLNRRAYLLGSNK